KRVRSTSPADAVIEEQERDYDLLMIGAAPRHLVGRSMIVDVLGRTKLPSVIVRATEAGLPKSFAHLMVPVDGSVFSREAAEFALAYAQAADAQVTLLHVVDETWVAGSLLIPDRREAHSVDDSEAARIEAQIREDFSALAERYTTGLDVRIPGCADPAGAIIAGWWSGHTALVVRGAENKLLARAPFFGQGAAAIVERAGCT